MGISKSFVSAKAVMAAAVAAVALALVFASSAFAATVTVSGTFTDGETMSESVDIDSLYKANSTPVYGMYYKSSAWNVLATTDYVSVEDVMNAAIAKYNSSNEDADYTLSQFYTANKTMTLTVADNGGTTYTKYYPTYADIFSTKYFFGDALNTNLTLSSSLLTSTNPTGAVLAKSYGLAAADSGAAASTAAAAALAKESVTSAYPRLITGCATDMTNTTAMGKRYVYDVTGITLS